MDHFRELRFALRRRWWLIAASTALALGGAAWHGWGRPPTYAAELLLEVESPAPAPAGVTGEGAPAGEAASHAEILRSRAVLEAVAGSLALRLTIVHPEVPRGRILEAAEVLPASPPARYSLVRRGDTVSLADAKSERPLASAGPGGWLSHEGLRLRVRPDAALEEPAVLEVRSAPTVLAALREAVRVEPVRGTDLVRVRVTDSDPGRAAAIANRLAESYRQYSAARARASATRWREAIEEQLAAMADSLVAARQRLEDYRTAARVVDPRVEGGALVAALMEAEDEVRELHFQEGLLQSLVESLQSPGGSDRALRRMVAVSRDLIPNAARLFLRWQELEAERERLAHSNRDFVPGGSSAAAVDSQIAAVRREMRREAEQSLVNLRSRLTTTEAKVAELARQVGEIPARTSEYELLAQQVETVQNAFDLLTERYHEARIAEATRAGSVVVVDPAQPPPAPEPNHAWRNLVLALLLGLAVGVVAAYAVHALDPAVRHPRDVELATGLPILGVVPRLGGRIRARDGGETLSSDAPVAEPFRTIRATIESLRPGGPGAIVVTSAGPAEGKSFAAANLAFALARQGRRVLLVDADLRRPSQHEILGFARAPGLADVLAGRITAGKAARVHTGYRIYALTSGTPTPGAAELLDGPAFARFIGAARDRFDAIIFDTPPVLAVADAGSLAPLVDGVVVIARLGTTNRFALARAAAQLRRIGAPLLGVVVNAAPASRASAHRVVAGGPGGDGGVSPLVGQRAG